MNFVNTGLDDLILKSMDVENPSEDLVKAMNRQGLVQKEVQVKGKNGKTFTRKQWVKASEAQSAQKQPKAQDKSKGDSLVSKEIIKVRDSIENSGTATTSSKEVADMYTHSKNSNRKFEVKDNKDGSYTITSQLTPAAGDTKGDSSKGTKHDTTKDVKSTVSETMISGSEFDVVSQIDIAKKVAKKLNLNVKISKNKKEYYPFGDTSKPKQVSTYYAEVTGDKGDIQKLFSECKKYKSTQPHADSTQTSVTTQKLSPAEAKSKTKDMTKGVTDKKAFMEKVKASGITWKENDHEGINWMRCCMALNKHFENGGSDLSATSTKSADKSNSKTYENGHIDKNGNLVLSKDGDLGDFVEELTGKDMFEQKDYAVEALSKEDSDYEDATVESMGIDKATRNKDGSLSVTATVNGYIHYNSDDGLGDDDYFSKKVTFIV